MSRQRCDFTGCTRYARPGNTRCTLHRDKVDRRGADPNPLALDLETRRALFGSLAPKIAQAAQDSGLDDEIGVLRLTMARLMAEEEDPSKLAAGVARLSAVVIQAMRAKRALSGEAADDLTGAVATILEELGAAQ